MSKALLNDVLLRSVGKSIISKEGKVVGNIIEVKRNPQNHYINYIILECEHSENKCLRYFAVPASTRFITISDTFTIYFQYPKEDIFLAEKIPTTKCSSPKIQCGRTIFELGDYHSSDAYSSRQRQEENQTSGSLFSSLIDNQRKEKKSRDEQKEKNVPIAISLT